MTDYRERRFRSPDGLDLYYRAYGTATDRTPLLCLTGLTRNARDYHRFALRHAGTRQVLVHDYRGRGRSAYDPEWRNYMPPTYVGDVLALLADAGLTQAVFVGTSLGGLVTMAANAVAPQVVKAAALNDIGPVVDPSGLNRIATYTGADVRFPDMANARRGVQGMFGAAYPGLDDAGWEDFVQRLFRWDEAARAWVLDYDLNLSLPIKEQAAAAAPPADLWPLYRMLRDKPVLVLRGALSDVLSAEIFERMSEDMPNVTRFAVPNRGHVPLLDEEPAAGAVDAFLAHV